MRKGLGPGLKNDDRERWLLMLLSVVRLYCYCLSNAILELVITDMTVSTIYTTL